MARNDPAKPKRGKVDTAAFDAGRIEQVPYAQLGLSPLNVRRQGAEVGPDDDLTASIRSHGLLQPLVGYIAKSGPAIVLICAGQRRFNALAHIAAADTPVPVRIVDEETAIEVSLAENLERRDMNPADEVLAFKALLDLGTYNDVRIATRFGFPLQFVRRRLKMAALVPEILDALREGRITVDAATAYAAGSAEVQAEIFKKHNAKGAWEPHEPRRVRQDISLFGISATSRVAKFIGGLEAYTEAGGTTIDEDFSELFTDGQGEGRLRDVSIVRQLIERRQAELAPQCEAKVSETYPFATGVEWMDVLGNSWGSSVPKPPKSSGLIVVEKGYGVEAGAFFDRVRSAAEQHGAKVVALVDVNGQGDEIEVVSGKFLVSKDGWEASAPAGAPESGGGGESAAEQAARMREHQIERRMEQLYARTLIGDTPGFEILNVSAGGHHDQRMTITLNRIEKADDVEDDGTGWRYRLKPDLVAPFREQATIDVDEANAARAKAEEEKQAALDQAKSSFETTLAELEAKPIGEWPTVVLIKTNVDDDLGGLIITHIEEEGEQVLHLVSDMEEPWSSNDVAHTLEVIRDQASELEAAVFLFDTFEAFGEAHPGMCRICGCVEDMACCDSVTDDEWSGPCSWADDTQTLCSNPDCLTKAGVTIAKEAIAA